MMDIESMFEMRRHHKDFHLGLGDIRLTIGDQESITEEIAYLRARIAELEELLRYIHDYSNDGYIVTRVEAALSGGDWGAY